MKRIIILVGNWSEISDNFPINKGFSRKMVGNFRQLADQYCGSSESGRKFPTIFRHQFSFFSFFQPLNIVFPFHLSYTLIIHEMLLLYQLIRIIIPSHTCVYTIGTHYLN